MDLCSLEMTLFHSRLYLPCAIYLMMSNYMTSLLFGRGVKRNASSSAQVWN